ncbi:MAG: hypothetical protein HGA90_01545 [Alphaproteobacteria bacterium]|nr:hypothetical protein [Alphaproteobacteria bacterium]
MSRASTILFWFTLTIGVSLALYGTSNHVQTLSSQLRGLNAQIEAEQRNIHVLKAEWVYLANPARIEMAARKYLAMHPTAVKQIASLENLPDILPAHGQPTLLAKAEKPAVAKAHQPPSSKVAAAGDSRYINNRMTFQPSTTAPATPDGPILLATSGTDP